MKLGKNGSLSVLIGLFAALLVIAACSTESNSSGQSAGNTESNTSAGNNAATQGTENKAEQYPLRDADLLGLEPTAPQEKYRLAVATPHVRDHFYIGVVYGIIDEAERWGAEVIRTVEAGGYANLNEQINQLNDLAQLDVDAIIVGPIDYQATASVIDEIKSKGIKIITTANTSATESVDVAVMYDDYAYGMMAADKLAELLGSEGNIVALLGPAGASWSNTRTEGFKTRLAEKYPGINIMAEQHTDVDRMRAQQVMEDWLQRFGDEIDGVYTALNLLAEGAAVAAEGHQLAGKIKIVTSASSPETLEMLKENKIHWVMSELGAVTGRWAVQYAFKVLNGEALSLEPAPETLPTPPSNIAVLPHVFYEPDTDLSVPYSIDWAPEGWTIPK